MNDVLSFLTVPKCMKRNDFKNGFNAVYMIMEIKDPVANVRNFKSKKWHLRHIDKCPFLRLSGPVCIYTNATHSFPFVLNKLVCQGEICGAA